MANPSADDFVAQQSITIRPTRSAFLIRGWLYFSFCSLLAFALFYFSWELKNVTCGLAGLIAGSCAFVGLYVLTMRLTLCGNQFAYFCLFRKTLLHASEVGLVFKCKMPESILVPTTKIPFTTKYTFLIVPKDLRRPTVKIDSSLFSKEDMRILEDFFGAQINSQASFDQAMLEIIKMKKVTSKSSLSSYSVLHSGEKG